MAGKKLDKCSAEYFIKTWKKYDTDGNGYIEDSELENFLKDLAAEYKAEFASYRDTFMDQYDKNQDGKIDMKELAELLNTEEKFLLLIRTNPHGCPDSRDFKKIWSKYDADSSGFIEASELKNFLKDTYASCGKPLSDLKLDEYTQLALTLYDKDGNHKLDFNEMIKLLPIASNYLKDLQFENTSEATFKQIFAHYDKNNDQSIADRELDALLADLLRKDGKPGAADAKSISSLKQSVMQHCDKNQDGKIQYSELKLVLKFKAS